MNDSRLWDIVTLELQVDGRYCTVASAQSAAVCLKRHWPSKGGPAHKAALKACLNAISGRQATDDARRAFLSAVKEAGIGLR